jgi:small-conductance mechanosensitive channel
MKNASFWVACLATSIVALLPLPVRGADKAAQDVSVLQPANLPLETEAVTVWGRILVRYRLAMEFPSAAQRARAAEDRIHRALGEIEAEKIAIQPMLIGSTRGVVVTADSRFLLKVMEGDLDPEGGENLEKTADRIAADLRSLVNDHKSQRSAPFLIRAAILACVATILFIGFWILAARLKSRLAARLAEAGAGRHHTLVLFGYDWRPVLASLAASLLRILLLAVVLGATYIWAAFVLGCFPYTRHWSDQLGSYLFSAASSLASGAINQIPDMIALVIICLVARGCTRLLNGWFLAVESGKHSTSWLDPEAAKATRRLTNIGVWIVALIVAFPYLPGSHSEAFKGISVFLGLMLSLGGASFVGQIIGGLAAVYSRAVRSGDFVILGETQGTVKELGLLTTKIVTRNREEVTIPNSLLMNSSIRNLSRAGKNATLVSTTVTIGYDAPWRQVQAMLAEAALKTEGILASPAPLVQQTALDDFYVRYELTACAAIDSNRSAVLDRLHGKIQDLFNENGVQIMSPHFENQPAASVIVPKERWHATPAVPPAN